MQPHTSARLWRQVAQTTAPTLFLATLLLARPGHGETPSLLVDCPTLPAADSAELETRIRTALLLGGTDQAQVRVTCSTLTAELEAQLGTRRATTAVPLDAADWDDRLLDAVDALMRLNQPKLPIAEARAAPTTVAPQTIEAAKLEAAPLKLVEAFVYLRPGLVTLHDSEPSPEPPVKIAPRPASLDVASNNLIAAELMAEYWGADLALGLHTSGTRRYASLCYGLSINGMLSTASHRGFAAFEAAFAGRIGYALRELPLRAIAGAGLSVLYLQPDSQFRPAANRYLAFPLGEVRVEWPFSLVGWGVVTGVGVRFFSMSRQVNANGDTALHIPVAVPGVTLGTAYGW